MCLPILLTHRIGILYVLHAGTGLTDWDNCSMYGKLMLFIFAAWAGAAVSGTAWMLVAWSFVLQNCLC